MDDTVTLYQSVVDRVNCTRINLILEYCATVFTSHEPLRNLLTFQIGIILIHKPSKELVDDFSNKSGFLEFRRKNQISMKNRL